MIYVPAQGPEDWQRFLADPEKQWKPGHSAHALAHAWQGACGFPESVHGALVAPDGPFSEIEPLIILPEHKVAFPPAGGRPSQNDVWVLARSRNELASIAVEGKVDETFGPTIDDWGHESSVGKMERFAFLKGKLELQEIPGPIRYQLIHRTVSAVLEAERFCAMHAVMLVHSFSPENRWFDDYLAFVALFGLTGKVNGVVSTRLKSGVSLHLGWIQENPVPLCNRE